MGSYCSVYFSQEKEILCGKYIDAKDVIKQFYEHNKAWYKEAHALSEQDLFLLFDNPEMSCWKESMENYAFMLDCFLREQPLEYDSKENSLYMLYNLRQEDHILKIKLDHNDIDFQSIKKFIKILDNKANVNANICVKNLYFNGVCYEGWVDINEATIPEFSIKFSYNKKNTEMQLLNFYAKSICRIESNFDQGLKFYQEHILPIRPRLENFFISSLTPQVVLTCNYSDIKTNEILMATHK